MNKLENVLESLLFLSGNPIEIKDIAVKLEISANEINTAIKLLKEKYSGDSGIHILTFNNKIQLSSNPEYSTQVETVLNPIKERELSKAMMEVASIIAYKQPATRLEIEEIRGVNSDYAIMMLTKHNIIEVVGRKDTIGKPLLYGTTDDFLKRFQLSSLDELPDYDEVLDRIKILHPDASKDLYYKDDENDRPKTQENQAVERIENEAEKIAEFKNENEKEENIEINNDNQINENEEEKSVKDLESEYADEMPDFLKDEINVKIIR